MANSDFVFYIDPKNKLQLGWDEFLASLGERKPFIDTSPFQRLHRLLSEIRYQPLSNIAFERVLQKSDTTIEIRTSGTTDTPKLIKFPIKQLIKSIKATPDRADDTWGLTYPLDRFSGLQVFFQAMLNRNTLVQLTGLSIDEVREAISDFNVTHLSATPTFYRLIMTGDYRVPFAKQITSSGEPLDSTTLKKIRTAFPKAKITNIYASSEFGSLLTSRSDIFQPGPKMHKIIEIDGSRLLVHKSCWRKPDLSNNDDFRDSGDRVEVTCQSPLKFRFVGRSQDSVLVGGILVNVIKVEREIESMPEVAEARVFGKANSVTGQLICCDIVLNPNQKVDEIAFRKALNSKLSRHEIPRIIKYLPEIEKTTTGKKVRH